jgi:hypothetical protein
MISKKFIEKKDREKAVKNSVANERLEGLKISAETERLNGEYIAGKLTADQMADKVFARYGIK